MLLKLVSFKACPFVQRAVIALEIKAIDYEIKYIDLACPPDWFLAISPLKKVPLLIVDNSVIFESNVINEYIDEAFPINRLHPEDLLLKAQNRSWIEFCNTVFMATFHLTVDETQEKFEKTLAALKSDFDQIEKNLSTGPFFNGENISMVDVVYAPAFQRLNYLQNIHGEIFDKRRHPHIFKWQGKLLRLSEVKRSCVPEIEKVYYNLLWTRQGYITQFMDEGEFGERPERSIY
ncbi:MAG: glutathione S-transferase family protein [Gammaproteobacteria bacterium]|nr:glutathione S-transferase family protein [Gammaproteobacteria bacterium]